MKNTCLACNSHILPKPAYYVNGFPIVRCPTCGLGWAEVPSDLDPTTIYKWDYFQGGQKDGYVDYQGNRGVLAEEFRTMLSFLASIGITSGRLLEIGCAYGYFLDEARNSFKVCGIELAEDAVLACRSRGLEVVQYADDSFFTRQGPFEVVVMLDVIEHLKEPSRLLAEVHQHMKPGSTILLTTGDFKSFFARTLGRKWRLMTPPQHLWFFTPNSITEFLQRHGFQLVDLTYPTKLVPVQLIFYQLARYIGLQRFAKALHIHGHIPINLHDAMRVVARRI